MNEEQITVSAEVKTYLSDLYNQIEYELRVDYEDGLEKAADEIERLNNIINELERWLIIQHDIYKNVDKEENTRLSCQYLKVKEKLQELKGSENND